MNKEELTIKVTADNYVWLTLTQSQVQILWNCPNMFFTMCKLYNDDSEAEPESLEDLMEHMDGDGQVGIGVGYLSKAAK